MRILMVLSLMLIEINGAWYAGLESPRAREESSSTEIETPPNVGKSSHRPDIADSTQILLDGGFSYGGFVKQLTVSAKNTPVLCGLQSRLDQATLKKLLADIKDWTESDLSNEWGKANPTIKAQNLINLQDMLDNLRKDLTAMLQWLQEQEEI